MQFEIVQGDGLLFSYSGLALAGKILSRTRLRERLGKVMLPDHPFPEIGHGEVAIAMIGLAGMGKPNFDVIEPFRNDSFEGKISEVSLKQAARSNLHGFR